MMASSPGRFATLAACWLIAGAKVYGQDSAPTQTTVAVESDLGIRTLPLWSDAPSQVVETNSADATLTVFVPHPGAENGTAVVIAPGGAYVGLASNLEGRQVADWFAARGITAFVLRYRLGAANPYPIPLLDARRAVKLVRSLCENYKLRADRIGIMGFSAGGHLAAMEATTSEEGKAGAKDPVDRFSDRPDFLILGYPWLNAMQANTKNLITYCSMLPTLPKSDCKDWEQKYSPTTHVNSRTPSTFIYSTTDDALVPVQSSVEFYSALLRAGVPCEIHLFRHGAHGSGMGRGDAALDAWPTLLEAWLRGQGWLPSELDAGANGRSKRPAAKSN